MSKELFVSSSPHETKVAVLEEDQLVEVYYERDTDVGLVGGIYKGRVNRVLPGMQSAFVDIGLERDAFLYVSDFFIEDQEEYDKVFEEAEARATRFAVEEAQPTEPKTAQGVSPVSEAGTAPEAGAPPSSKTTEPTPAEATPGARGGPPPGAGAADDRPFRAAPPPPPPRYAGEGNYRRPDHQGRRRRHRGRGFGERKFVRRPADTAPRTFEVLPGESLAKYSHATPGGSFPLAAAPPVGEAPAAETTPAGQPEGWVPGPTAAAAVPTPAGELESMVLPEEESGSLGESSAVTDSSESPGSSDQMSTEGEEPAHGLEWEPTVAPLEGQGHSAEEPAPEWSHAASDGSVPSPDAPADSTTEGQPMAETGLSHTLPLEAVSEAQGGLPAVPSGTGPEPTERSYTMREPYQRPRFAPRRGPRGRRGGRHLPRQGGRPERLPPNGQIPQISQLLKEGQEILVQIAKEPLGSKGARITSHIALPGRYLVFMPTLDHIGVSRKVSSEQERLRLRNIVLENKGSLTGGFIVRTAGEGRTEEEFKADLKFLSTSWNEIKAKAEQAKAPALIHRDLNLVQRILRDTLSPDFKSVRVDSEVEYERVVEFVNRCQPSLAGHVKLYTRDTPLFEEFGIEAEIEKALKPKVWLKSGGYIVINQTEALVAIDVNTGKYVGKTNRLEDTILKTNIDAVNEIVRQMRLRDLGGIIVIDFIDMDERRNRIKVVQVLEDALRHDRAPTKVTAFHDFGLVAITRKRVKQSLERTLCEPCDYCSGAGWIKSVTSVCYEILAEARKMARQIEGDALTLRVNPEVAKGLKSREGVLISELESITHKDVIIKSDPAVHRERFEIF